ncbi:MAG: DNA repair protein RadC [Alphaproteobacteria bacterium]
MTPQDYRYGHRQRLRERLLTTGEESFADYELLEMLLFLSHPRGDVKPIAKDLLKKFGSLQSMFQASSESLMECKGFGETSAAYFKMIHALSQRLALADINKRSILSDIDQLVRYCRLRILDTNVEQFHVFYLDKKKQFIADEIHQKGTVDHTMVYPRELIKKALDYGASYLLLIHNHPSGDCTPSDFDIDLTEFIAEVGAKLGIEVLDHLVISTTEYKSIGTKSKQ